MTVIHWFRRDLRLQANTALQAALDSAQAVIPLFVLDPAILKSPSTGAPRLAFLLNALQALDESLQAQGSRLMLRHGDPQEVIPQLAEEVGATALYFNRDYTPYAQSRDAALVQSLTIETHSYDDAAILPPGAVLKDDGDPYMVYTPFMKKWKQQEKREVTAFKRGKFHDLNGIAGESIPTLEKLGFEPTIELPPASEAAAQKRLERFVSGPIEHYAETRNSLIADPFADDDMATSCLSPYLRFGLLSPRTAYWSAREAYRVTESKSARESIEIWVNELIWRDFYMHIMAHFPHVDKGNFREIYNDLQWDNDEMLFKAWQDGQTGYPLIDAAMRQLKAVGWMPNRARMIVASFLTKDLLVDWRKGERHFMQCLIDGDPAANNGGWQWAAGTGTDAQPYFRIFNPVSQSEKFDPDGTYIRHWIPELRAVPDKFIHAPWKMDESPQDYPAPVVDHAQARERTLEVYKAVR